MQFSLKHTFPGGITVRALNVQLTLRLLVWLSANPFCFEVTTLGKLFTNTSVTRQYNMYQSKGSDVLRLER